MTAFEFDREMGEPDAAGLEARPTLLAHLSVRTDLSRLCTSILQGDDRTIELWACLPRQCPRLVQ